MQKAIGFFLLLSLPLFGQAPGPHYTWTPSWSLTDNTPNCATINCLTSIAGDMAETKAGYDGTIYGLSSSSVLYTYTPANGWVEAPSALQTAGGYSLVHVSVASAGQVLALNSSPYSSPYVNVYVLNSAGNAWLSLGNWVNQAEIGADGTVWALYGTAVNYWNGSTWKGQPGALKNIANAGNGNVWGVTSTGALEQWNGTAFAALSPAPNFTPSQAVDAVAAADELSLAVLDTSGGIHVSTTSGQTWSTIQGTASSITGGGVTMFTRSSAGVTYHINLVVPQLTVAASGYFTCTAQGGCNGAFHTITANAYFGGRGGLHGTGGVWGTGSGPYASVINVSAVETGTLCDPFYDPDGLECGGWPGGTVNCSIMGFIVGAPGGGTLPFFGVASTLVKNLSGSAGYDCSLHGTVTNCWWNTAPNCANTSSPVWSPPAVYDSPPGLAGWWSIAACVRAGTSQPWLCFAIPREALKTTQTTPGQCTGP